MKYLSELTNKVYNTPEELDKDEEKFKALQAEREQIEKERREKEKRENQIREAAEKEIYQVAKELADKRKELNQKLDAYTDKYKVFNITDDLKNDRAALDEVLIKYKFFPFFHI